MKLLCFILITLSFQVGLSQSATKKKSVYRIHITHLNGKTTRGFFQNMTDSTLRVARVEMKDTTFKDVSISEIKRFFVRKNGIVRGSIAIGLLAGSLIGLSTYDPCVDCFIDLGPGPPLVAGAVIGGFVGTAVGLSIVKKWEIEGSREQYQQLKPQLLKYCAACN